MKYSDEEQRYKIRQLCLSKPWGLYYFNAFIINPTIPDDERLSLKPFHKQVLDFADDDTIPRTGIKEPRYFLKSSLIPQAKPILDLISTAAIFSFFIPLYLYFIPSEIRFETTGLIINLTTTIGRFFDGVIFTSLLVLGIHMPTILGDLEQDRQVGDMTTAVWLDAKNEDYPFYFTAGMILVRVGGFALMNVLLMISSVIAPSYLPFILGMIEILLVIRMLRDKSRQSAINLWKGVIVTSMIGGILFGILYSSV